MRRHFQDHKFDEHGSPYALEFHSDTIKVSAPFILDWRVTVDPQEVGVAYNCV